MSELFATIASGANHWTLNSCFVAFRKVWVHLGSFRYCTKLGAKWAKRVQLMQKFMPRSDIGIFRNERTESNPLDLCSILVHLGMFCYDSKLGAKWAKLVQVMQKFVPQSRVGNFCKERTQSTPLDPELMFCCAS